VSSCGKGEKANGVGECACEGSRICSDGVAYVTKQLELPAKKAIICCEGGCIKGEIARVATNFLAYKLQKSATVRICLGDAATGNSGFINLVSRAPQVIAIEGCPLQCGTEIIKRRLPDFSPTIVDASQLYSFDRTKYFEILDMPRPEIEGHAIKVATYIEEKFFS